MKNWFDHAKSARRKRSLRWVAMCTLLAAGCSDPEIADLQQFVETTKASTPGLKLDPLPEVTPYRPFTYAAQGLKDPFIVSDFARQETVLVEQPEVISSGIRPDPDRIREELEKYSLGSLKMVGTLLKDQNLWALIKAPDGIVHRVRKGNYLGTDHGKIIDITDQRLELTEIVADGPSQWTERNAFLSLSE